jgi:pseudaminic acid biosynthesis-associated methylase
MEFKGRQVEFWTGEFGQEYTERNSYNLKELNDFYQKEYGISRTEMNSTFLKDLPISKMLEVGCNVGNQLRCLKDMNYKDIFGIELQWFAVEKAKESLKEVNIIQGEASDIPFKDSYFDLVFTSGVLIHIAPEDINAILDEIYRVSKKYIWGFEYFSEVYEKIDYRGNDEKLWKGNFCKMYLERFPDLRLVKEAEYSYVNNENVDQMFLLEKIK